MTFVKGALWAYIIPPFQSPDEQNHFAYVQSFAEMGRVPNVPKEKNVTLQLIKSTQILNFDWKGSHPMWTKNIFIDASSIDKNIRLIPDNDKTIFVSYANGFKNPPIYYFLASLFYKISSNLSIFESLYSVRILSVLFGVATVFIAYKIALMVTGNNSLSLLTAASVSFQPSFTNITSTVTNDSMAIAVVSIAVYAIIRQYEKPGIRSNIFGLLGGFLALITRVHLGVLLFCSFFLALINSFGKKTFILVVLLTMLIVLLLPKNIPYLPFGFEKYAENVVVLKSLLTQRNLLQIIIHFAQNSIPHYVNNVFSWYWGVFGWLEITLPAVFYTVFKIFTVFSVLGFILKGKILYKKLKPAVFSAFVLFATIFIFDFITFFESGELVGVQGRHLLPSIIVHILLLFTGLILLTPNKFQLLAPKLFTVFMFIASVISFYSVIEYFYGINNDLYAKIEFFKPVFINQTLLLLMLSTYLATSLYIVFNIIKLSINGKSN